MASSVKTRFLLLSDTHGQRFPANHPPPGPADVAIHCGDLTEESKLAEFHTTLDLLRSLDAPLKLVIAGNHDWTLDLPIFRQKVAEAGLEGKPGLVAREYGEYGEVRRLFDAARNQDNIHLLNEGTHRFTLANGAALTVYASPYTPSATAGWGFQYRPADGHDYAVAVGTDVAVTHSPPAGVLDRSAAQQRLGCPLLFRAVEHARPRLHCFGHVHEGWGTKLVAWRSSPTDTASVSHFTAVDQARSQPLDTLASFRRGSWDDDATAAAKAKALRVCRGLGHRATSHCTGDDRPLEAGRDTLFVNASIAGSEDMPFHLPWCVNLELNMARVDKEGVTDRA